jgi:signal transduction histidine kinase/HAMP domain-containing protein
MKAKTKIIGAFSLLLVAVLLFQSVNYILTKKSFDYLEDLFEKVEQMRHLQEARRAFMEKRLAVANYILFGNETDKVDIAAADPKFLEQLSHLEADYRVEKNQYNLACIRSVLDANVMYNRQKALLFSSLKTRGRFTKACLDAVITEGDMVLDNLENLLITTGRVTEGEDRLFGLFKKVNRLAPFFTPLISAWENVQHYSRGVSVFYRVEFLAQQRALMLRRVLMGQDMTAARRFRSLEDEFGKFLKSSNPGLTGRDMAECMRDIIFCNGNIRKNFHESIAHYSGGNVDGARKDLLRAYLNEQMMYGLLSQSVEKKLDEIESSRVALEPIKKYAVPFNMVYLIYIACGFVVIFIMGAALIERMFRPIIKLNCAAQRVADGDLLQVVPVESSDEIGELAASFNRMTKDLAKVHADLKNSHEKYKNIVENVGAGILLVGPGMEVLGMNKLLARWFPELIDTGSPFCFCRYDQGIIRSMEYGLQRECIFEYKTEKEPLYFRVVNSPFWGEMGTVVGAVQIFEDITVNLKAEREKARLVTELERSNGELADFAYIASHDLQAPVRKIVSFGQILEKDLKDQLSEDSRENLNYMVNGALHMQRLINDLLTYSRVTTNGKPLEPVGMREILDEVLTISIGQKLEETGGTLQVEGVLPWVLADPIQLHQLLQNLIDNGLKYHRDGVAPVIKIRSSVNPPFGSVTVEVEDNGIGIEEKHYEKIFKMFSRLHGAGKYSGTGIGLAVCQRIVKRLGGEIGVRKADPQGSVFWFSLNMVEKPQDALKAAALP